MLRRGVYARSHSVARKYRETDFLFCISRFALIDAILLTGIGFPEIR